MTRNEYFTTTGDAPLNDWTTTKRPNSFLNPGDKITAEKFGRQIDELHAKRQHMSPALVNRKGPILLHDNARPNVLIITRQKLHDLK